MTVGRRGDVFSETVYSLVIVTGIALVAAAIAWPTVALILRWARETGSPEPIGPFGTRQMLLLGRTLGLAVSATIAAHLIAIALLMLTFRCGVARPGSIGAAITLTALTCPPFAYAFGWDAFLPAWVGGHMRCVWNWTLWSWPIPLLILAAGWSRVGNGPFEAATIDAGRTKALGKVVLPALRPYLVFSFLMLLTFLLQEYSVPHACGLQVFATELLTIISSSARMGDALIPALLPVSISLVLLLAAMVSWRRMAFGATDLVSPHTQQDRKSVV